MLDQKIDIFIFNFYDIEFSLHTPLRKGAT